MAVLEGDLYVAAIVFPWIECDPVHFVEMKSPSVLTLSIVTVGDIDHIVVDVLFHDIPWASAQSEPFALTDCVEPIAPVCAQFPAGLNLDNRPGLFSKMPSDKIVVVDFTKETYALAIVAISIWHCCGYGYFANLRFWHITNGENQM